MLPIRAYQAAAIIALLAVIPSAITFAAQGHGLYMTSGVWGALAADLASGQFYRPVFAADGYGGTRYMPLFFVLHSAILSIINHPVLAAYCVVYASALAFVSGLFAFLRASGVSTRLSAASAVFVLAGLSVQYALVSTRGDLLAAALNMWGLALCARALGQANTRRLALSGLLFGLAFMTKFSTLFGLAACVICFAARGRRREAIKLFAFSTITIVAGVFITYVASGGRVLDSFLASASGGMRMQDIASGPYKFLFSARLDFAFLIFFACGVVTLLKRRRTVLTDLPSLAFTLTLAATVVIMASPGTDLSHLIDLTAASIALSAIGMSQFRAPKVMAWSLPAAALLGAICAIAGTVFLAMNADGTRWSQHARVMEAAGDRTGPLLADNPWIPILAGERPFVLDNFALRLACEQRPDVEQDLFERIEHQYFRAVVLNVPSHLRENPQDTDAVWRGQRWYGELFYPPGFHERLLRAYEPEAFIGEYIVLLPKARATTPSAE